LTKDEARKLVQEFFRANDAESPGLNEQGLGGASLTAGDIFFEYLPEPAALKCSALIYRFRGPPNPAVIAAFHDEAKTTDTGGGTLDYETENRGVYLSRVYERALDPETFTAELRKLLDASQVWRSDAVERVADKAYGRAR